VIVFHDRAIRYEIRDDRSAEIASTPAAIFRQIHDDGTKSVEVRLVVHLAPVPLDMEETGPRQDCQMGRHCILRDLASSGDVTRSDGVGVCSNEPTKCCHAGVLRERSEHLDGGSLIGESRHADPLIENHPAHNQSVRISRHMISEIAKKRQFTDAMAQDCHLSVT
jgi:hypothetical protein